MKLSLRSDARGWKDSNTGSMPRFTPIATVALAIVASLLLSFANAQLPESASCSPQASSVLSTAEDDWRVVADVSTGLALLLPVGHELAPGGSVWYVHGTMDGEPLVPDVRIQLHLGQAAEEVASELFAEGAELEPVTLGPAAHGYRVVVPGRPGVEGYLAVGAEGTYSIVRYEDFDWAGFDQVACSFHLIQLVSGQDGL